MITDKKELRRMIRQKKSQFSKDELIMLSESIIDRLLSHEKTIAANVILMYYSLSDEVDTTKCVDRLLTMGKTVLLPRVINDEEMELCYYRSPQDLTTGAYGIKEPIGDIFTDYETIDLCVVPGMSFDRKNNRLGRGKGYYDRFLCKVPNAYKIGICFDFQKLPEIPADCYDQRVDEVL